MDSPAPTIDPNAKPSRSYRLPIFVITFLVIAAVGLAWNYSRDPVYQTQANLLTVQPGGVDQLSPEEDKQHVAIQRRALLSDDLLATLKTRLAEIGHSLSIAELREMLAVQAVEGTNLVELSARGGEPQFLQDLVSLWTDIYLANQEVEEEVEVDRTLEDLQEQQRMLELKLEAKRAALKVFREKHDIASLQSEDNAVHARLKGLNKAINDAKSKVVAAQSELAAHRKLVEDGKILIPREARSELNQKVRERDKLATTLERLNELYKPNYIKRDPAYRDIPVMLEELETEIATMIQQGRDEILGDDQERILAAQNEVSRLEQELIDHKHLAAEFTARFEEHQARIDEIEQLEELHKENVKRLAKVDMSDKLRAPEHQIVDRPFLPQTPIFPHYQRDTGIVLGTALAVALFLAWLFEFLTRKPEPKQTAQPGININITDGSIGLSHQGARQPVFDVTPRSEAIAAPPPPPSEPMQIAPGLPQALSNDDLRKLLDAAVPATAHCLALMLHGLSPEEIANLSTDDLDVNGGFLTLSGQNPRMLNLSPGLRRWLGDPGSNRAWQPGHCLAEELNAGIAVAVNDAGLEHQADISLEAIRHTYILYLVQQGAKLSELASLVGPISNSQLATYAGYSPSGPNKPLNQINLIHPVLA